MAQLCGKRTEFTQHSNLWSFRINKENVPNKYTLLKFAFLCKIHKAFLFSDYISWSRPASLLVVLFILFHPKPPSFGPLPPLQAGPARLQEARRPPSVILLVIVNHSRLLRHRAATRTPTFNKKGTQLKTLKPRHTWRLKPRQENRYKCNTYNNNVIILTTIISSML